MDNCRCLRQTGRWSRWNLVVVEESIWKCREDGEIFLEMAFLTSLKVNLSIGRSSGSGGSRAGDVLADMVRYRIHRD